MAEMDFLTYKTKSGRQIVFRHLAEDDAENFINFRGQIANETTHTMQYVGMMVPSIDETKKRLNFQKNDKNILNIGAFDGDRLVAYLNFRVPWEDHPWVQHVGQFGMMVFKEYWGQGIGSKLLKFQEIHAQKIGIHRIEATVRLKNDRGLALYERQGFKIEGTKKAAAKIDEEFQDEFLIAKILGVPQEIWKPPVLITDRLILRPIDVIDAEAIFSYAKNPNVCRYTLWEAHQSVEDSLNYIKDYIFGYYSKGVPEPFGITLKDNPQNVIGTVGCFWTSKQAKAMELAYAIAEEHWGKGLVVEASQAVMDYCFREFNLKRIQARCKTENIASSRVMEKLGMSYEGTLKSAIFHRDRYWDMRYYAKVQD